MGGNEWFSSKKAKVSQFNQLPSVLIMYVNIVLKQLNVCLTLQFSFKWIQPSFIMHYALSIIHLKISISLKSFIKSEAMLLNNHKNNQLSLNKRTKCEGVNQNYYVTHKWTLGTTA